jgi:hypothetical protein
LIALLQKTDPYKPGVEVTSRPASAQPETQVDLSVLSDEELETLDRLTKKVRRCPDQPDGSEVLQERGST